MTLDMQLALAINRLSPLRALEKALLADVVDSEEFYVTLTTRTLSSIVGRVLKAGAAEPETTLKAALRDYRFCEERNISIVPVWDGKYPAALREIYDPPFLLFVRGILPPQDLPAVAVVGTREPSAEAAIAAQEISADIARAGHPVISGLARGIDLSAHTGALSSRIPGSTGAVLGCGIDRICPAGSRGVAQEILENGGFILSEYSPGVPSAKYHFPARNRIISGMSRGVVVVQAPARSGALITAEYALDQGRDLFVHRDGVHGPVGAGTRDLADDGARIVSTAADLFEEWGLPVVPVDLAVQKTPPARGPRSAADAGRDLAQGMQVYLRSELNHG